MLFFKVLPTVLGELNSIVSVFVDPTDDLIKRFSDISRLLRIVIGFITECADIIEELFL